MPSFCLFFRGEPFDRGLVHAIESVIIEWTHQIQNVLKRNSAQPLLEGQNPGPLVELDFWKARAMNLECIFEQVRTQWKIHINKLLFDKQTFLNSSCLTLFVSFMMSRLEGWQSCWKGPKVVTFQHSRKFSRMLLQVNLLPRKPGGGVESGI